MFLYLVFSFVCADLWLAPGSKQALADRALNAAQTKDTAGSRTVHHVCTTSAAGQLVHCATIIRDKSLLKHIVHAVGPLHSVWLLPKDYPPVKFFQHLHEKYLIPAINRIRSSLLDAHSSCVAAQFSSDDESRVASPVASSSASCVSSSLSLASSAPVSSSADVALSAAPLLSSLRTIRAVETFDGDWPLLKNFLEEAHLFQRFEEECIESAKLAAASSNRQQANDLMTSHRTVHHADTSQYGTPSPAMVLYLETCALFLLLPFIYFVIISLTSRT